MPQFEIVESYTCYEMFDSCLENAIVKYAKSLLNAIM